MILSNLQNNFSLLEIVGGLGGVKVDTQEYLLPNNGAGEAESAVYYNITMLQ